MATQYVSKLQDLINSATNSPKSSSTSSSANASQPTLRSLISTYENRGTNSDSQKNTAVDKAGEIVNSTQYLSNQLKRLQDEKAARSQVWENGIYMGEDEKTASDYDSKIADIQKQLKEISDQNQKTKQKTSDIRDRLIAEAKGIGDSSGYVTTVEQSDELETRRKNTLDALHQEDERLGNNPQSYDARERAGNIVSGSLGQVGAAYTNLLGTLKGAGNRAIESSNDFDKKVAASDYSGWATDELSYGNIASGMSDEDTERNLNQMRTEEQRLYDLADKMQADSSLKLATAKEGLGSLGQFGVDVSSNMIQMGIDAVGNAVGLGMIPFFARAAGGAMQEARQAGGSTGEQILYGLTSAAIELGTEKLFDGVAGIFGKGAADEIVESVISKLTKSDTGRTVLRAIAGAAGEGSEEVISDLLTPFAQTIYNNKTLFDTFRNYPASASDMLYDFLVGAAIGAVGGAGSIATGQDAKKNSVLNAVDANEQQTSTQIAETPQNNALQSNSTSLNIVSGILSSGRVNNTDAAIISKNPDLSKEFTQITGIKLNGTLEQNRTIIKNTAREISLHKAQSSAAVSESIKALQQQYASEIESENAITEANNFNEAVHSSGFESYVRGLGMGGMSVSSAREVLKNPALKKTWEQMTGIKLPESNNRAVDVLRNTDLSEYTVPPIKTSQNNVQDVSDFSGNIETPPTTQNSSTASPALFNTQANEEVNVNQQNTVYNNAKTAQNQMQYASATQDVNGNIRERGFSENIRTDAAMEQEVRDTFETDPLLYQQQSNEETLAKAKAIYSKGTDEASKQIREAIGSAKKGFKLPVEMIPLSRLVANDLAQQGRVQEARDILSDVATELTYYGQASQAARILRESDPMTQATAIERMVDRLNSELTKGQRRKNKTLGRSAEGDIVINQSLLQQYVRETDPAVKDNIISEIQQDIADQIPATFAEKFTALRYLNMLGNLKTQGRNVIGNTAMLGITKSKNLVKASIEGLAYAVTGGKYERTTSFLVNSELRKEANADADLMMDALKGQGKYSDSNKVSNADIQEMRKIFDSEFLEGYRKLTNLTMELGDLVFLKATYSDALGGWLQAHGINSISEATPEQLSKARAFAIKEAQEATFRDSNAISDWVSSLGRSKNTPAAVKFVSEGIAPFRKTPANVAIRAVEYSPLGLSETIVKGIQTKSGKANAADVINSLSKNVVGSALFAAGMLAASAGFARGTEDDEELDQFQKMQGAQDYSIKMRINGEDVYISLSQFAPAAVPFFIGVEFSNALASEGNFADKLPKIIGAVSGPMLEMSMLGGINDALSNLSTYGNTSSGLPMLFANSAISYLTQGLTNTLLGQLEQANEEYRQTTYTDKNSKIPSWLQKPLGKAAAKTPGIDYNQQDYIDAWGRRQSNGNALERYLNALANPTYYGTDRSTSVDAELERLYSENKNVEGFPNVLPDKAARSTEYTKGQTMTPEEYQQYSIDRGTMSLELIQDFMSGEDYKLLTDQQRADVISNLYSLAADRAMKKVKTSNGVEYTGDLDDEAELSDIPAYYSYKEVLGSAANRKSDVDYLTVDGLLSRYGILPDDVKNNLKEQSSLHIRNLEYAGTMGIGSEAWYKTYDEIKDARVKTASQAQTVTAAAVAKTATGDDEQKLNALRAQIPPEKGTGDTASIVRRYEAAIGQGYSFDDWTKFEAKLNDINEGGGTPSKTEIYQAAKESGVDIPGWQAYNIYKKYSKDEDYVTLYDETYAALNPSEEKVPGINLTDYLYGDGQTAAQQSKQNQYEAPSYLNRLNELMINNSNPDTMLLDYNTIMSMVK